MTMVQPTAIILYGKGIGCEKESDHAYKLAGAKTKPVHINELIENPRIIEGSQIVNFSGGFLHGDKLDAGMCAAGELGGKVKDALLRFAAHDGTIYGQCNGFQVLVNMGLLPGIKGDYSKISVALTNNDCGSYRVDYVRHKTEGSHFAFKGIDTIDLWCRHGEGKLVFSALGGVVSPHEGNMTRKEVNDRHVLLRYADKEGHIAKGFPENPNGSVDAIAGLVDITGMIFGHMAHTEVGVYRSRSPEWRFENDKKRRSGLRAEERGNPAGDGLRVFQNIVNYYR